MIAQSERIRTRVEQFPGGRLGNPEPGGGVLRVGHDEIQVQPTTQSRQMFRKALSPRPADNVAKKSYSHLGAL